ncbi:MAG: nucleoside deaminase [Methanomicrobiales archaeon]|nr:nucleoside deaminase [Methanomicrobiales archaeon]
MHRAIAVARQGIREGQTPFGACIVRDGALIACDHNRVWEQTDSTAHAEILAIRAACQKLQTIDLSGAVMYATCEPCPMCFAACHWARIGRIVSGAFIRDAARYGFHELPIPNPVMAAAEQNRIILDPGVCRDECLALFAEWEALSMSRPY